VSYCRFSSDNWRSDVYVYEHCDGGFITHIAGRKRMFPPIPSIPLSWMPNFGVQWDKVTMRPTYPSRLHKMAAHCAFSAYAMWHRLHMWTVNRIPLRPIGLPHDGESFCDETAGECADRLEAIRSIGYHVPQYAINALREEDA